MATLPDVIKKIAKLRRKKVGVALGGGAAKGLAQIGVLEVLEESGIPIDMIAGTSIGAVIGAIYAQGKDLRKTKDLAIELGRKRMLPLLDLVLPRTGFISGRKVEDFLKQVIGDVEFKDLKIPFACVATDVMCGEEVVIRQGSVVEAVRASMSIPAVFMVARWKDRYCVDGGLVNPVPVSVLREMGADYIIAVDVVSVRGHEMGEIKKLSVINVLIQSLYIGTHSLAKTLLAGADTVINPQVEHIGFTDFHRAPECIRHGEIAARQALLKIKKGLRA
ncbi:MAG: patatin-like phospholipase family protein [Chloroflexota bacterium]|nr:patatin-like phospholipase family protein [Chloroflexota bacterium]